MASIIYLGHASFLLIAKDFSLVIDPYQRGSVPNMEFPKIYHTIMIITQYVQKMSSKIALTLVFLFSMGVLECFY